MRLNVDMLESYSRFAPRFWRWSPSSTKWEHPSRLVYTALYIVRISASFERETKTKISLHGSWNVYIAKNMSRKSTERTERVVIESLDPITTLLLSISSSRENEWTWGDQPCIVLACAELDTAFMRRHFVPDLTSSLFFTTRDAKLRVTLHSFIENSHWTNPSDRSFTENQLMFF